MVCYNTANLPSWFVSKHVNNRTVQCDAITEVVGPHAFHGGKFMHFLHVMESNSHYEW